MSGVARKYVFGVSDQVRQKPDCAAMEASLRLEIPDLDTLYALSLETPPKKFLNGSNFSKHDFLISFYTNYRIDMYIEDIT